VIDPRIARHCLIMKSSILWVVLGCSLHGCGGDVNLGHVPGDGGTNDGMSSSGAGSSSGGSGGSSGGSGSSSGASGSSSGGSGSSSGAGANPLSGTYTGYIESFQFADGSDVVVMKLSFATDGTVTGTVYFGTGSPLPPPTDPNVGYPPGFGPAPNNMPIGAYEGFDFTVLAGSYAAPRLKVSLDPNEVWKQWCGMQTVIYALDNGDNPDGGCGTPLGIYGCLPNAGFSVMGSTCTIQWCQQPTGMTVDCGKMALCLGGAAGGDVCTCTATSCTVPTPPMGSVAFDMQLTSGSLDGSVTGLKPPSQVYNVHLNRGP
jgi:hypothetical protein